MVRILLFPALGIGCGTLHRLHVFPRFASMLLAYFLICLLHFCRLISSVEERKTKVTTLTNHDRVRQQYTNQNSLQMQVTGAKGGKIPAASHDWFLA